jgi:hypothetical protein
MYQTLCTLCIKVSAFTLAHDAEEVVHVYLCSTIITDHLPIVLDASDVEGMQEHSPAQAVGPRSSLQKPSTTVAQVRSPSLSFPVSHPALAPLCPTRGFEFFCNTGVKLTACDCLQDGLPSTRYEHHTS